MSHLGRWLSALVDSELDGDERDRVLNHLARCTPCRQEANALRALKRRMTALGEDADGSDIAGRLLELARSETERAGRPGPSGGSAAMPTARMTGASWMRQQVTSGWMLAASSAGLALTAIGAVAFVLGGAQPAPVPRVTPAVETYWRQHGYDTGQEPAGKAGAVSTQPAGQGTTGGNAARPGSGSSLPVASSPAWRGTTGRRAATPAWASPQASTGVSASPTPTASPQPAP
jgi:anti-sigma factor RsiW